MIPNRDQTYSYIFCGPRAEIITYYETPTTMSDDSSSTFPPGGSVTKPAENTPGDSSRTPASTSSAVGGAALKQPHSSSTNLGTIIGGTLGGIGLVALIGLAVVWFRRRQDKARQNMVPEYMSRAQGEIPGYGKAPKADRIYEMSGRQIQPSQELSSLWHPGRNELPDSRS
jgi:hypothetical protein